MIRDRVQNLIKKLVSKKIDFSVIYPPKKEYGDYSVFFPQKQAENLKQKIEKEKPDFLEKVELAPPARLNNKRLTKYRFLNFYLKKEFLQKQVGEILKKGKDFGEVNVGKRKKTNIEFISANPTGELHIGNGRGAFFGDVLANILEKANFNVEREYYINNAKNSAQIKELGKTCLDRGTGYKTPFLDKLIIKIKEMPQFKKIEKEVDDSCNDDSVVIENEGISMVGSYPNEELESKTGYFVAKEIFKNIKIFIEKKLKIRFDNWFEEEKLFEENKINETLSILQKTGLTYKKDGALWLKTSKFGDSKDEVIIRKTGEPTYFLADIAYHKGKVKRGYRKIIDIWGADHQGHIKRMEAAMEIIGYKGEFDVLISQIVRLKSGKKLSKRKGDIIKLEDLIDEVGLDVARFFYLSKSLSTQMEFDLDLAKEQSEKNPVYYIQYAYARIHSILAKIPNRKSQDPNKSQIPISKLKLLNHSSELNLIRELIKFPEIIEDTVKDYQLQRLPEYGKNLATAFHQFYRDCRVLSENKNLAEARLALILSTKIVLSTLLSLIGISAPERM